MKIVRIIARLNVGGPARHVVWLNEALQDSEFDSVLITGRVPVGEEDMSYFAEAKGVEPIFIEQMSRELSLRDLISLWKIYREIVKQKPDIIHTHTAKAGTIGRIAGFLYRWLTPKTLIGKPRNVRVIHTFHGHIFHGYYSDFKTKIFIFIERFLAKFATDKIVVISEQQKREINHTFNVGKSDQFEVIRLGLDLEVFENWKAKKEIFREEIGAKKDEIIVGLVGRLTEIKNHEMFLRVIKMFTEDAENSDFPKVKFVIIGDGHTRGNLEKMSAKLGVEDSVQFLGNRNDPEIFYAGLDIVALTSLNEGTPLSLIEAMANEKPIVSTSVGGVVDLLGETEREIEGFKVCERGLRVDADDVENFYRGLVYLIKDKQLRQRLSENGKGFVLRNYDKKRLIADIKSLYQDDTKN